MLRSADCDDRPGGRLRAGWRTGEAILARNPEPLRENLAGFWSRRIDGTDRLAYAVDVGLIIVISCRYHY
jgi:hypothetical protein